MEKIWVTFEIDEYRAQATFRELKDGRWKEADASWFMRNGPRIWIKKGRDGWKFIKLVGKHTWRTHRKLTKSQVKKLKRHSQL